MWCGGLSESFNPTRIYPCIIRTVKKKYKELRGKDKRKIGNSQWQHESLPRANYSRNVPRVQIQTFIDVDLHHTGHSMLRAESRRIRYLQLSPHGDSSRNIVPKSSHKAWTFRRPAIFLEVNISISQTSAI